MLILLPLAAALVFPNSTAPAGMGTFTAAELASAGVGANFNTQYKCEVGPGSPLFADMFKAAFQLALQPGVVGCNQNNGVGSKCTRVVRAGSAAISICGRYGVNMECRQLGALSLLLVVTRCRAVVGGAERTGGLIFVSEWAPGNQHFKISHHGSWV